MSRRFCPATVVHQSAQGGVDVLEPVSDGGFAFASDRHHFTQSEAVIVIQFDEQTVPFGELADSVTNICLGFGGDGRAESDWTICGVHPIGNGNTHFDAPQAVERHAMHDDGEKGHQRCAGAVLAQPTGGRRRAKKLEDEFRKQIILLVG